MGRAVRRGRLGMREWGVFARMAIFGSSNTDDPEHK